MNKSLLKWEVWGIAFTVSVGTALHFAFAWTGGWPPVGIFAAVNESVWEHLKLAYWPSLAWACIEAIRIKDKPGSFWAAKSAGIITMPLIIVAVFYAYTSFSGHPILPVDIGTFFVAVLAGQMLSYRLMSSNWGRGRGANLAGVTLLVLIAVAFGVFTFQPPHLDIFHDTAVGGYGILK